MCPDGSANVRTFAPATGGVGTLSSPTCNTEASSRAGTAPARCIDHPAAATKNKAGNTSAIDKREAALNAFMIRGIFLYILISQYPALQTLQEYNVDQSGQNSYGKYVGHDARHVGSLTGIGQ